MFTLIRWLIRRYKKKKELTPAQQVEAVLVTLRQASPDELGGILAVAMQAKKTLDTTRIVGTPFPVDILDGQAPLDDAARARLDAYVKEIMRFRAICLAEETILAASVARGLDTWIATFFSLILGNGDEGREIWAHLVRGEGNVEAAYRFMTRRDLTDVERDYLTYRPRILLNPR